MTRGNYIPEDDEEQKQHQYKQPTLEEHPQQYKAYKKSIVSNASQQPWDSGFDQADHGNGQQYNHQPYNPQSSIPKLPSDNRATFEAVQKSKNRTVIFMLILVEVFLATSTVLGGVCTAMGPWWKHSREVPAYEWIHISLWEACYKGTENGDWLCNSYEQGTNDTPYTDMGVIQKLSLAGVAIAGLTFIFSFVAVFARKAKMFRAILYTIAFMCLAAAALMGTCIGLVTNTTEAQILVPPSIQLATSVTGDTKVELATMFFLECGAAATVFLALVFTAVILFVHDDLDLDELAYDDEEDETDGLDDDGFPVQTPHQEDYQRYQPPPSHSGRKTSSQPSMYLHDARYQQPPPSHYSGRKTSSQASMYLHDARREEKRRQRRSRDHYPQDMVYTNPAFHQPRRHSRDPLGPVRDHHEPLSNRNSGQGGGEHRRPLSHHSSGRYSSRPSKPPRAHTHHHSRHQQQQQPHPRAEDRQPPTDERLKDYEDYEMYFNTPY